MNFRDSYLNDLELVSSAILLQSWLLGCLGFSTQFSAVFGQFLVLSNSNLASVVFWHNSQQAIVFVWPLWGLFCPILLFFGASFNINFFLLFFGNFQHLFYCDYSFLRHFIANWPPFFSNRLNLETLFEYPWNWPKIGNCWLEGLIWNGFAFIFFSNWKIKSLLLTD